VLIRRALREARPLELAQNEQHDENDDDDADDPDAA
jgi:hypothetical protein